MKNMLNVNNKWTKVKNSALKRLKFHISKLLRVISELCNPKCVFKITVFSSGSFPQVYRVTNEDSISETVV